jgi:hypothetical protein
MTRHPSPGSERRRAPRWHRVSESQLRIAHFDACFTCSQEEVAPPAEAAQYNKDWAEPVHPGPLLAGVYTRPTFSPNVEHCVWDTLGAVSLSVTKAAKVELKSGRV